VESPFAGKAAEYTGVDIRFQPSVFGSENPFPLRPIAESGRLDALDIPPMDT
jgi:hypothetical protein